MAGAPRQLWQVGRWLERGAQKHFGARTCLMSRQMGKALLEGMLLWGMRGIRTAVLLWSGRWCLEKGSISSLREQRPG